MTDFDREADELSNRIHRFRGRALDDLGAAELGELHILLEQFRDRAEEAIERLQGAREVARQDLARVIAVQERMKRGTAGCAGYGPSPAAQAGPPTYAPYRRPPLPSRVLGQIPFYPRKPTSICPSCFRQFVLTGARPGGLCDACVMRRQTWAAPPRAPPEFWNPGNIGRRY